MSEDLWALGARLTEFAARAPLGVRGTWIYGAGGFGRRLAAALGRLGRPVLGFLDARVEGPVDGLPCRRPEALVDAEVSGAALLLGVMNHATPLAAVADWAAARGFADIVFPGQLHALPGFALENYWFAPPRRLLAGLDRLAAFEARLEDAASRRLLRDLLTYRVTTDPRLHPPVDEGDAYRPDFLPLDGPVSFIDGGAFTGDTLEALIAGGVRVADWLAFEPDPGNRAALAATARRHAGAVGGFTLVGGALSDRAGTVRFAGRAGAASRVDAGGETLVEAVRLDDVAARSGLVYVKLDVEGAEAAALAGMAGLLARRPLLAVSVYHRPEDLWEIPEAVLRLYPRPRLRLRQHGHNGFDTVLYAMP